jgi:hypothetical protein
MRERTASIWMTIVSAVAALAATASVTGCEPVDRPTMNPGEDCMSCHSAGQPAAGLPWTAAGTIFKSIDSPSTEGVAGVKIMIRDYFDGGVTLVSNSVGNFYTRAVLYPPLDVSIQTADGTVLEMSTHPTVELTYGDGTSQTGIGCNYCHRPYVVMPDGSDYRSLPDGGFLPFADGVLALPWPDGGEPYHIDSP